MDDADKKASDKWLRKRDIPDHVVEKAREHWARWINNHPHDPPTAAECVAAFAAEYAADWKRKAGAAEDAYFAAAGRRQEYLERAEAAERELISLTALKDIHAEKRHEADRRAASAEKDRDALLSALGFKPGPIGGDRQVILADVSGLRPEMVKARREAAEAESEALTWRYLAEEEREACAKVAEDKAEAMSGYDSVQAFAYRKVAAAIRARKGGE